MSVRSLWDELVSLASRIPPDVLGNILSTPSAGHVAMDDYYILIDICKAIHNVGGDIDHCVSVCQQVNGKGVRDVFAYCMNTKIPLKEI